MQRLVANILNLREAGCVKPLYTLTLEQWHIKGMATANDHVFNLWAESLLSEANGGFSVQFYTGVPPTTAQDTLNPDNLLLTDITVPENQLERTDTVLSKVTTPAAWEDQSANRSGIVTFARVTTTPGTIIQLSVGKAGVTYDPLREVLITVPETLDYGELGVDANEPYIVAGGFVAIDTLTLTIANPPI